MPDDSQFASPASPATSRLAIASLVCGSAALLTTCIHGGLLGMCAVVIGMVALDRLRARPDSLRGRGLARTGIALGTASAALGLLLAFLAGIEAQRSDRAIESAVRQTLESDLPTSLGVAQSADLEMRTDQPPADPADGQPASGHRAEEITARPSEPSRSALAYWTPMQGKTILASDLERFACGVRERYGALRTTTFEAQDVEVRLDGMIRSTIRATLTFERARLSAQLTCIRLVDFATLKPVDRLESIVLLDGTLGYLSLPEGTPVEKQ